MTIDPFDAAHAGTPPAEIEIDADLVRCLLAQQHPDLAALPIAPLATGWDNAMFRLGEYLLVRLPRRRIAAQLIVSEQTWLGRLSGGLPLPIPTPVRLGVPGLGYPWRWSVSPWFAGTAADLAEPDADQGEVWAEFLKSLHQPAPMDAPRNPVRDRPLGEYLEVFSERAGRVLSRTGPLNPRVLHIWARALEAPANAALVWLHGDLHARNVLVEGGRFSAVIDWGDMTRGDAATGLSSLWMLLPAYDARVRAMAAYDLSSEATWDRARGWAVLMAVTLLDAGLIDDPRLAAMGEKTLRRLIEGP